MKIHTCKQGSPEWNRLRAGKITASDFEKILTPGGKLSAQSGKHMNRLLVEYFTGLPLESVSNAAMEAGREREPEARAWYQFRTREEVQEVGFCELADGFTGCSPDGLVGSDGLLEIKCPEPWTHIGYLRSGQGISQAYKPQIQGQLFVTGRNWLDSVSYCPPWPISCVRVCRDDEYIEVLAAALGEFHAQFLEAVKALETAGMKRYEEPEPEPEGDDWLGVSEADVEAILGGRQ